MQLELVIPDIRCFALPAAKGCRLSRLLIVVNQCFLAAASTDFLRFPPARDAVRLSRLPLSPRGLSLFSFFSRSSDPAAWRSEREGARAGRGSRSSPPATVQLAKVTRGLRESASVSHLVVVAGSHTRPRESPPCVLLLSFPVSFMGRAWAAVRKDLSRRCTTECHGTALGRRPRSPPSGREEERLSERTP